VIFSTEHTIDFKIVKPKSNKYEYCILDRESAIRYSNLTIREKINKMGKEGWKIVGQFNDNEIIFMRELNE